MPIKCLLSCSVIDKSQRRSLFISRKSPVTGNWIPRGEKYYLRWNQKAAREKNQI